MDYDFKAIGSNLRNARESQGITVRQLAQALECSTAHIYGLENGEYFSMEKSLEIAKAIGLRPYAYDPRFREAFDLYEAGWEVFGEMILRDFALVQLSVLGLIIRLSFWCFREDAMIPDLEAFELHNVDTQDARAAIDELIGLNVLSVDEANRLYRINRDYASWGIPVRTLPDGSDARIRLNEILELNYEIGRKENPNAEDEILVEIAGIVKERPDWGDKKIIRTVADLDPEALKEFKSEVPIVGRISAGEGVTIPEDEDIEGKALAKISKSKAKRCFAVRVKGDSMKPVFPGGTLVVIDPDVKPSGVPIPGAIRIGNEVVIKQASLYVDALRLQSLNKAYDDIYLHDGDDFAWIGGIVGKAIKRGN